MKFLAIIFLVFLNFSAQARTGAGIMLGSPTGLSFKHWMGDSQAVDVGMGLASKFQLHSDYLFHEKDLLFLNDVNPLDLYFGLGARMKFEDDIILGLRAPVGLAYTFPEVDADAFLEVAPIIDIVSHYGYAFHFLIGSRYYF